MEPLLTLLRRAPWWMLMVVGIACVGIGVSLTFKPFRSLSALILFVAISFVITGVSEFMSSRPERSPWLSGLLGVGWIAAGIGALAWPDLSIGALAIYVGAAMLVGGVLKVVSGVSGSADDRLIAAMSGLASVTFGILALSWPDVTVLVVALLVGPRMIIFGFGQIGAGWARRSAGQDHVAVARTGRGSRFPYLVRLAGSVLTLLVALGLLAVRAWINKSSPKVDAFYDAPDELPLEAGRLVRTDTFTRAVPQGADGWRILYTTTRDDGTITVASAIVVAPGGDPTVPRSMIAWTHGTTGIERNCAPSVAKKPFESGGLFLVDEIVAQGWVLVATDYVGQGTRGPHPYLIGPGEGRSALDAIRAARQMPGLNVADETVVWGHSQGGHAALWTGILAPAYAPDAGITAVAALAPASDLAGLISGLGNSPIANTMFSYVLGAYSRTYDDVGFNDYVRPAARTQIRKAGGRCLTEPAALVSIIGSLPAEGIFSRQPTEGPLGERLRENTPSGNIGVPLLIAQGRDDTLVLPGVQDAFVQAWCDSGQSLEYRTYEGRDHIPLVEDDSPLIADLLQWTRARFTGDSSEPGCRTTAVE